MLQLFTEIIQLLKSWFKSTLCGLWLCLQCHVVLRQRWKTLTCLVTGGLSTLSTPSSATSAIQDLDSAIHQWYAVKLTDSGRNPKWNVLMVRALLTDSLCFTWSFKGELR